MTEVPTLNYTYQEIRRLQILSQRQVSGMFTGGYRSVFHGRGIEFEEVLEYQPGDDVRSIDWNVTARSGHPFVKRYIEERDMTVMLVLDRSGSLASPSPSHTAERQAAEICAILATAASASNDRIGLLTFSDGIESFIPPSKGPRHSRRVISTALQPPGGRGTDLAGALEYLGKVLNSRSILFVISDFVAPDFTLPLAALGRRHDLVAVVLHDPAREQLAPVGLLRVSDPETSQTRLVDTSHSAVRQEYQRFCSEQRRRLVECIAAAGADQVLLAAGQSPARVLARFFQCRRQQRTRR